jgi:hypothetical protein
MGIPQNTGYTPQHHSNGDVGHGGAGSTCGVSPASPCTLFSPADDLNNTSGLSHVVLLASGDIKQFKAWGLKTGDELTLMQVSPFDDTEEPVVVNGATVSIKAPDNYFLLAAPGRYRWRFSGVPGDLVFVCENVDCCAASVIALSRFMKGS